MGCCLLRCRDDQLTRQHAGTLLPNLGRYRRCRDQPLRLLNGRGHGVGIILQRCFRLRRRCSEFLDSRC